MKRKSKRKSLFTKRKTLLSLHSLGLRSFLQKKSPLRIHPFRWKKKTTSLPRKGEEGATNLKPRKLQRISIKSPDRPTILARSMETSLLQNPLIDSPCCHGNITTTESLLVSNLVIESFELRILSLSVFSEDISGLSFSYSIFFWKFFPPYIHNFVTLLAIDLEVHL